MHVLSLQVGAEFGFEEEKSKRCAPPQAGEPAVEAGREPMKAYAHDLHERVLRAVDRGYPRAEIVQLFGISLSTLKRYLKRRREEGHVRPKAIPGRPPKKRAQVEAGALPQLQAHDDATVEHHCTMWEQTHGERVSRWTMSRLEAQVI